jgi:hypothetical protein
MEIPLRAKYRLYSFSKKDDKSIGDKGKLKQIQKKEKKTSNPFDNNAIHLYVIAGFCIVKWLVSNHNTSMMGM